MWADVSPYIGGLHTHWVRLLEWESGVGRWIRATVWELGHGKHHGIHPEIPSGVLEQHGAKRAWMDVIPLGIRATFHSLLPLPSPCHGLAGTRWIAIALYCSVSPQTCIGELQGSIGGGGEKGRGSVVEPWRGSQDWSSPGAKLCCLGANKYVMNLCFMHAERDRRRQRRDHISVCVCVCVCVGGGVGWEMGAKRVVTWPYLSQRGCFLHRWLSGSR